MRTTEYRLAVTLLVIVYAGADAGRALLFSSFSEGLAGGTMATGTYRQAPLGIELAAGSRARFDIDSSSRISNVSLHLDFYPPKIDKTLLPLRTKRTECFCALTILAGRLTVELSDLGIRISALDSLHKRIDTSFAFVPMNLTPDGSEVLLELTIMDNEASVILNGQTAVQTTVSGHDFRTIFIDTYQHSFTLASLVVYSLAPAILRVNADSGYVDARAEYFPSRFNSSRGGIQNHHFIAWKRGKSAPHALFVTDASDSALYDALVRAGATPGNNLSIEAWDKRISGTAAQVHASGTALDLLVLFAGRSYQVKEVLRDVRRTGYDFRFSGNVDHFSHFNAGCIACLQSCPAGVVGNSSYTMHDLAHSRTEFEPHTGLPFNDGDQVVVRFHVKNRNKE